MVNYSYYAILGILGIGPMSGYKIKSWVDEGVGYFLDMDYKQIYPTLKKIVEEEQATFEVVKSGNRPASKLYKITDKGLDILKDWIVKPIPYGKNSIKELMLKLFFGHYVSPEILLGHLESFQISTIESMKEIEEVKKSLDRESEKNPSWHYRMSTVMRGEIILRADLEWCNKVIGYLKDNISM